MEASRIPPAPPQPEPDTLAERRLLEWRRDAELGDRRERYNVAAEIRAENAPPEPDPAPITDAQRRDTATRTQWDKERMERRARLRAIGRNDAEIAAAESPTGGLFWATQRELTAEERVAVRATADRLLTDPRYKNLRQEILKILAKLGEA